MEPNTILGHFAAPGSPSVDVTWLEGTFRAGDEVVPHARIAAWDDAGHVRWVSDETRAWFASQGGAAEGPRPSPAGRSESTFKRHEVAFLVLGGLTTAVASLAALMLAGLAGIGNMGAPMSWPTEWLIGGTVMVGLVLVPAGLAAAIMGVVTWVRRRSR